MKLEFLSKSSNESFARVVAASFATQLNPTLEELSDIKTAVSEAVTNSIIHGYEFQEGMIVLEGRITGDLLEIKVTDKGKGINDIDQALEPFYTSKPDMERSGMGFTVMQTFMDEIFVESISNEGTTVTMNKKIKCSMDKE